jgi:hypothetical protein
MPRIQFFFILCLILSFFEGACSLHRGENRLTRLLPTLLGSYSFGLVDCVPS